MSGVVRQLDDGLEEAVVIRHIGEVFDHRRRHRAATCEVNGTPIPDQAALGDYSGRVAMKPMAITLGHPAERAITRLAIRRMEYSTAEAGIPRAAERCPSRFIAEQSGNCEDPLFVES